MGPPFSVVIGNLDIYGISIPKSKAKSPAVVDSNTILSLAIAAKRFEAVRRQQHQVFYAIRIIEYTKTPLRLPFKALELFYAVAGREPCSAIIAEGPDHELSLRLLLHVQQSKSPELPCSRMRVCDLASRLLSETDIVTRAVTYARQ